AILEVGWSQPHLAPADERELVTALVEETSIALERAALRTELAGRAEGAEGLHRVAARLAGRLDVVEIANEALTALRPLYEADAGAFYLTRTDGTTRSLVTQGLSVEVCDELHEEYASGRRGDQLSEGRSIVVASVTGDRRLRTRGLLSTQGIVTLI